MNSPSANGRRKVHLLKRWGYRAHLCDSVHNNRRPAELTNDPTGVTCKACLHLFKKGEI